VFAVVVRDEIRQARPHGGPEETGGDPVHACQRDDERGVPDERQCRERRSANQVGDHHQAPP
jgi:hypothetical protein